MDKYLKISSKRDKEKKKALGVNHSESSSYEQNRNKAAAFSTSQATTVMSKSPSCPLLWMGRLRLGKGEPRELCASLHSRLGCWHLTFPITLETVNLMQGIYVF